MQDEGFLAVWYMGEAGDGLLPKTVTSEQLPIKPEFLLFIIALKEIPPGVIIQVVSGVVFLKVFFLWQALG